MIWYQYVEYDEDLGAFLFCTVPGNRGLALSRGMVKSDEDRNTSSDINSLSSPDILQV
jgi:hypothetical protein